MKKLLQLRFLPGRPYLASGLLLGGFLLGLACQAQDTTAAKVSPDKWDLRRCVDYAVANNISIKQSDIQARLSKLTYNQSQWNQVPTVNLGTGLGINSGRSQNPTNYTLSTITYFSNNFSLQSG